MIKTNVVNFSTKCGAMDYKNKLFKKIGLHLMSKKNSVEIDEIHDIKLAKEYL